MSEDNLSQYSAYIGLDWADTKHDVCVQPAEGVNLIWTVISKINSFSRSQRLTMLGS